MPALPLLHHACLFFRNPCRTVISFSSPNFKFQALVAFSTSNSQNPSTKTPLVFDYLTTSCGFSTEEAMSVCGKITDIRSPKNTLSVISFFRSCGFSDTQIRNLISQCPKLLASNVEKTLVPKIKILEEIGISGPDLPKAIVSNYTLLTKSVKSHLIPTIDLLRTVVSTDKDVARVIKSSRWDFYIKKYMLPNISSLQKLGVPIQRIQMILVRKPTLFTQSPGWLEGVVARVEKLGLTPQDSMFIHAVLTVGQLSESTLDAKFDLFKSFEWSEDDIRSAVLRNPYFMVYSKERIQKLLHYYETELGCGPSYIASRPKMLCFSLEKRVIPRYNVLRVLETKNLLKNKKKRALYMILDMSEKKFIEDYVNPHKGNVPDVLEAYKGCM